MKPLTEQERRTVRLAAIGVSIYLALFFGFKLVQGAGKLRADYEAVVRSAHGLRAQLQPYEARTVRLKRLMERFQLDPGTLSTNTVVGETSAAIQRAATSGGLQLGPIRETSAQGADRALGAIQFDAAGQSPGVLKFVAGLGGLGYPVVVESVQIAADPRGPGMVKVHLSLIIFDYTQWKPKEAPRA